MIFNSHFATTKRPNFGDSLISNLPTQVKRRQEIGLRRALGATRRHIRNQFLGEAVTLSVLGGIAGAVLGILVTAIIATFNGWPISLPIWAIGAGLGVTVLVGIVAGIFPASRGAKLPPTAALSI